MIMGTLGYMSPEQIRGPAVDERTDIYAMGVILFQMFAGKLPYPENTLQEILSTIEAGNPPDLALLRPDLPPDLAHTIRRCMQKEADQRFPTARALLSAFN
jgi:serine/threonine-protein kinase